MREAPDCVVIGGGPAGLTAAYELGKLGRRSVVLEADTVVGGLARTAEYKGYRFDVGGHRFFTKVPYVQELWEEILGDEFLVCPRLSRIFYRGKLFDYPLKPFKALRSLGPVEAARVVLSYVRARAFPERDERDFAAWVSNRFGRRLYEIFFKTYTEKVWGMPCTEISADWAAQRIKNLDLVAAILGALGGRGRKKGELITSLVDRFHYPRHGPGQMWNRCAKLLRESGSEVALGRRVTQIRHAEGRVRSVVTRGADGVETEVRGEHFFSTMPIRELLHCLEPAPPEEIVTAADRLRYRDFLTVALVCDRKDLFPDNWIYVHSPEVRVGRIQNYKNWSPDMVPDASKTALGLEYFVQEGDELWSAPDEELIALGRKEVALLGLVPAEAVEDGTVLRMKKAYPVYDDEYKAALQVIRGWLTCLPNLQLIGRNGQHHYNNQDHSMMTGVYAARNVEGGAYDVWDVNVEQDYHEKAGERLVPLRVGDADADAYITESFARYDAVALGVALATVLGLGLFLATAVLLLIGGEQPLGPTLSLLGNYSLGYEVTWVGALIGLVQAAAGGFLFGWSLARMINLVVAREERLLRLRIEQLAWLEGGAS